jgi:hypothetical protein
MSGRHRVAWLGCISPLQEYILMQLGYYLRDTNVQNTTALAALRCTSHRHMFYLNVTRLLLGYGVDVNAWSNPGL